MQVISKHWKRIVLLFILFNVAGTQVSWAFPNFEEWVDGLILHASTRSELSQKAPEPFVRDALAVFELKPPVDLFMKLHETVCFNVYSGEINTRLNGAYELEQAIDELNLTHVKVPKHFYWRDDKNKRAFLFSKKIVPRYNRKISIQEILEIKALIDHTGFSDFNHDNLIAAEDGVYFVDTGDFFGGRPFNSSFLIQSELRKSPGFSPEAIRFLMSIDKI